MKHFTVTNQTNQAYLQVLSMHVFLKSQDYKLFHEFYVSEMYLTGLDLS